MTVIKATKKPVTIEAIEWNGSNVNEVQEFCNGEALFCPSTGMSINTLEGGLYAAPGDYIIKGIKGEFYPCKPDIFHATYDMESYQQRIGWRKMSVVDKGKLYSLVGILGSTPCNPKVMEDRMDTRFKLFAKFKEGDSFCTNCATLTPSVPRSHHKECFNYKDLDSYEDDVRNEIGKCPDCGGTNSLSIESCRENEISVISCYVCDYEFRDSLCEEDLIDRFKKENGDVQ